MNTPANMPQPGPLEFNPEMSNLTGIVQLKGERLIELGGAVSEFTLRFQEQFPPLVGPTVLAGEVIND